MSIFTRIRRRFQRRNSDWNPVWDGHQEWRKETKLLAPADPGSEYYRNPPAGPYWDNRGAHPGDAPTATLPAPVPPEPAVDYDAQARQKVAELAAQAEAEAKAARDSAATTHWAAWDSPGNPPMLVPLPDPPPMPPSDISRAMVSQIPDPPVNDRNASWTHGYAEYMRRIGVATGTATELEHTMAWGVPALAPGDGTGEPL